MKARIHLHSFEALACELLVPSLVGSGSASGQGIASAFAGGEHEKLSLTPRHPVPGWMAAADAARPPNDPVASASPLNDL